jgi:ribonuclease HI
MAKKQKYYVVWEGKTTGIFTNWADAERQIKGVQVAKFQSFEQQAEAEAALKMGYWAFKKMEKALEGDQKKQKSIDIQRNTAIEKNSICVDAACSGNPGDMEYRGVVTTTGEQLFHQGPLAEGTNNIGEFLAIVHALAMLQKQNRPDITIYTDSKTAIAWVRNKHAKTNLEQTARNRPIFQLIDRATNWLKTNTYRNPIVKWETEDWGEIPADFGRK